MNRRPHQQPERTVELEIIERNEGSIRRHRRLRALAGAVVAATASLSSATLATGSRWTAEASPTTVPVDRGAGFDSGPAWSPDYGLLCEILERYGSADRAVCATEPITSIRGPV